MKLGYVLLLLVAHYVVELQNSARLLLATLVERVSDIVVMSSLISLIRHVVYELETLRMSCTRNERSGLIIVIDSTRVDSTSISNSG